MAVAGSLIASASVQTRDFSSGMAKMRSDLAQTTQVASVTSQGFAALGRSVTGLAGAALSLNGIRAGVESIVRTGLDLDRLRSSFTAITGSAQQSRQEFAFVRDTASRLGLDIQTLGDSYRQLLAATRGTQIEGQATRDLFTALTNASRAYGLSTEQTGRALLALQQIVSKGRVSQEELRGQLGEALPGASQIAARAFGVTTAELDKLVEKGVDATTFIRRFTEQLNREAPPAIAVAGKGFATLGSEIVQLKDRLAASGLTQFFDNLAARSAQILQNARTATERSRSSAERRAQVEYGVDASGLLTPRGQEAIRQAELLTQAEQRYQDLLRRDPEGQATLEARARLEALEQQRQKLSDVNQLRRVETEILTGQQRFYATQGTIDQKRIEAEQQVLEAARERERTAGRFNEIANAAEEAAEREAEQQREIEKNARQTVQAYDQLGQSQDALLRGLQDELDGLKLTEDALRRKTILQSTLTDAQRAQANAVADEIQAIRDAQSIDNVTLQQDNIGPAAARFRRDVVRENARSDRRELQETQQAVAAFADFFTNSILDASNIASRGIKGFVDSAIQDLQRLLFAQFLRKPLENLLQGGITAGLSLLGGLASSGGNYGGLSQGFDTASLPYDFGTRAEGGPVNGPGVYRVGERGPETLFLSQGQNGYVYPRGQMPGGVQVTNNFYVNGTGADLRKSLGEIDQRIANAVRRGLAAQ